MLISSGLYEIGHVLLYIAGFGYSDMILEEFNIYSSEDKFLYYGFIFILALFMHYYFGKYKKNI